MIGLTKREIYIAGTKKPYDWRCLKDMLANCPNPALWQHAFDEYFMRRLTLRYLNPISILQRNGPSEGEGFSIMAILCSLVEFLESTFRGLRYRFVTHKKELEPFEYNVSMDSQSGKTWIVTAVEVPVGEGKTETINVWKPFKE